jgi:ribosomal protein S12 methylthiotransferase
MPAALPSIAPKKVGMISLGCAKNLVDAEIMLGSARAQGLEITADADEADVLIVNTCAFIDSAKEESIEAILEAHRGRGLKRRAGQKLIVSGCMAQRFSANLQSEMPEVDAFMGLDQVADAGSIISQVLARPIVAANPTSEIRNRQLVDDAWQPLNLVTRKPRYIPDYDTPRFRLTPKHSAYVKIAEGCNHPCSFCVIPQMRGKHRSRTIESVVHEVRDLVAAGTKEINLISQDTTYFGMDLWEQKAGPTQPVDSTRGVTLCRLLEALEAIEGDFWIRLLYTHPAHWSGELIETIARCRKVARYVDMPLQHIHPVMLDRMRRETSSEHIVNLIARIRAGVPGIALRTTFIVGFPGETEEHFAALLEFIESTRFERLGIFMYSREDGSRAAKMDHHVHAATKRSRYGRAMALQQRIARGVCLEQVGKRLRVLVESPLVARSEADAPDIDGRVVLDRPAPVGEFIEVEITGTQIYDLVAQQI